MKKIEINYKSDFNAILGIEGGWGVPFKAKFWAATPSRSFTATYDGATYTNCHPEADGRMCFGFDNHDMGTGDLMLELTFYLDNQCFTDGICSEVISQFNPTFIQPVYDEHGEKIGEEEYQVVLGYKGASTLTTIGTLPAFYQKGDPGKSLTWDDLTPEQKAELKGEPGYTPQKGVDYFDGNDGDPGAPGAPGKDGRDGGLIYPSYKVDPHNMHLYSDTDTNRVRLSKDKHFTVKF